MDPDEERDFADQALPQTWTWKKDTQILATLLKHIHACINTADIDVLLEEIPVQPPVVIPANVAQVEGYGADESESVAGSSIDKEGEAGACELCIRYPTFQAIYAGITIMDDQQTQAGHLLVLL
jgi:hypothetical protein